MSADTTQGWENRTDCRSRVTRVAAGLATLVAVICVTIFLMHRTPPQKAAAKIPGDVASQSSPAETPAVTCSRGVVTPKVRVEIMPEVAGKVIYVHSQLHTGGLIRANERIAQIDPSSYELIVRRARAAVDEAQARLDLELVAKGMRQAQGRSWDVENQVDLPAVLHEPLIRQTAAALESAKAELAMAELQLSRTSIVLPFDVLIEGPTVSLGQYVDVGRSLAVAYGTEAFEIEAPVQREDLKRLGITEGGDGSEQIHITAEIRASSAGSEGVWRGNVVRTTGQVDRTSGMTSVVVEVPDPLGASTGRTFLLPGTPVEVSIGGNRRTGALQEGERD
jgi:membrane fusion protein, multidrug efflux system